jgi:hypothetical protein
MGESPCRSESVRTAEATQRRETVVTDCDCTEEYGPCEEHGETLVSREGAAVRTADDLLVTFIDDARDAGRFVLSPWGEDVLRQAEDNLSANESMGVRWLSGDEEGASIREDLDTLQYQVEAELATAGLSTYWEDGYRIVRITGGPLADSE